MKLKQMTAWLLALLLLMGSPMGMLPVAKAEEASSVEVEEILTEEATAAAEPFAEEAEIPAEKVETSVEETETPAEDPAAPAEEIEEAPAEETTAPVEETESPAEDPAVPAEETAEAATEDDTEFPAEEVEIPVKETEAPGEEIEAPAGGTEVPVEETAEVLTEEATAPVEETMDPAEEGLMSSEEPLMMMEVRSLPLNLAVVFNPAAVNIGQPTQVSWEVTGGISPEIEYANWRIYDATDTIIGTIPAPNITALTGTVNFTPSYGAKAILYLHVKQGEVSEGITSTSFLTINDAAPLTGTITFDKTSVDVGDAITANWTIAGGNNKQIVSSEWVLYDRQGGIVKTYQAGIGAVEYNGNRQFTTPTSADIRERAAEGLMRIRVTDADGRDMTFESDKRFFINHWENQGGKYYYYRNGEKIFGGPHLINGKYYYFHPVTREMATGWISAGATTYYYAAPDGVLYVNKWLQEGSDWYYFKMPMGVMARDETILISGQQHSFDVNGKWLGETEPFNGWYERDRKRYFNKNGTKVTGWLKDAGKDYYMSPSDGSMQTGWVLYNGYYYYLRTSGSVGIKGSMVAGQDFLIDGKINRFNATGMWLGAFSIDTGWVQGDAGWYYYQSGVMQNGWVRVGTVWYYMNAGGIMQTGWRQIDGSWYYFASNGSMHTGWLTLGPDKYYLFSDGVMATGQVIIGANAYTFDSNGVLIHTQIIVPKPDGWSLEGGVWYYYQGGIRVTGWLKDGSTWYYLKSSGAMVTGWLKDGGTWYYLNSSGAMATGWLQLGSNWFYLKSDGAMATGWLQLGSNWFYLKSDGIMVTGIYTINGRKNVFGSDGIWIGYK